METHVPSQIEYQPHGSIYQLAGISVNESQLIDVIDIRQGHVIVSLNEKLHRVDQLVSAQALEHVSFCIVLPSSHSSVPTTYPIHCPTTPSPQKDSVAVHDILNEGALQFHVRPTHVM